jgi:ATP-dependent DNA helicase RecQ
MLKDNFPGISVHAFTATATYQVRLDIAEQLRLADPEILVGSFDRPNLLFKVQQRSNRLKQIIEAIGRHPGESGIVYCLRRDDTEKMAQALQQRGYRAAPYHAGLEDEERRRNQDAFINEAVDIIAATVAFGMGIDKSNVRYVLHAGMPKSLEHYQQESGRAGRDGLEAECTLFYSAGDFAFWRRIIDEMETEIGEISLKKLYAMYNYCTMADCRHQALSHYFGQDLSTPCNACDVCLGFLEQMDDSLVLAQKILSCIMRLKQSFGADYTVKVLTGSQDKRILQNGHDHLSTYNLLSEFSLRDVRDWTEQLVAQGYAQKTGEYNILQVTPAGWQVLKGLETPRLTRRQKKLEKKAKRHRAAEDLWAGVDVKLFETLKALRLDLSRSKGIPPFIIFSDASLRDMARLKPRTATEFLAVKGVGEMKKEQYGKVFLTRIGEYLAE